MLFIRYINNVYLLIENKNIKLIEGINANGLIDSMLCNNNNKLIYDIQLMIIKIEKV